MQHDSFCKGKGTVCNFDKGVSMERGAFRFQKGEWNRISINVTLNNPANVTNGILEVRHNGRRAIYYDKMNYRQLEDYKLVRIGLRIDWTDSTLLSRPASLSLSHRLTGSRSLTRSPGVCGIFDMVWGKRHVVGTTQRPVYPSEEHPRVAR